MSRERFLIAYESAAGTMAFLSPFVEIGWTPFERHARRFTTEAEARATLDSMAAPRNGRRLILSEVDSPKGPAHREVTA